MTPLGPTPAGRLLSWIYGIAVAGRNRDYDRCVKPVRKAGRPVISVGGVHAGGTGKTPCALLVGRLLSQRGIPVAFLSRGYRRRSRDIAIVKPGEPAAWRTIGDEPALLRSCVPQAWLGVGTDRAAVAGAMTPLLPDNAVFVLDDGFQHRRLHRDLDMVCLPADPFADRLIPVGTLREPLDNIKRAHLIALIGGRIEQPALETTREKLRAIMPDRPICILYTEAGDWTDLWTGARAARPPLSHPALISGIARPQRFEAMVRNLGIAPAALCRHGDHHIFRPRDIARAMGSGADGIITTHKDAIKIRDINLVPRPAIWYLIMQLLFSSSGCEKTFEHALSEIIPAKGPDLLPNGGVS
jgi:tetraacyldisaccharide 4'-kinase